MAPCLADSGAQRGIALITAILVVALAAIAATAMYTTMAIAQRRTELLVESEAAEWVADGVETWVLGALQIDAATHSVDSLADVWAQPVMSLPLGDEKGSIGNVSGRIEDLQGRFNLNNLGSINPQVEIARFRRLLESIPGIDPQAVDSLGPVIRDWIDSDEEPYSGLGAESDYYLSLNPPYRTANRLMLGISELLPLKGMTPALYDVLNPYVAALPTTAARINLNTAPLPVLMSLSAKGSRAGLEAFLQDRVQQPLQAVEEAIKRGLFPDDPQALSIADVRSSYFGLAATVTVGRTTVHLHSLIYRPPGGTVIPSVVIHSFGGE